MIRLTRRYDFSAAHVLARQEWSDARNRDVYGKCANPAGHGHNYRVEVTVEGAIDARTGRLVELAELDRIVRERVVDALDQRLLNREVPEFARAVPTAENIARIVWDRLNGGVSPARLAGIRLVETSNNSVEYAGGEP